MRTKIIIFISIGLIWSKAIADPGVISVRGAKVELVELYEVFSTVGQCKIDEARDYYAKVPGNLEVITLKQGNKVRKGEVLLVIDKAIARSIKMQAQAMLKSAEAAYKRNKLLYSKKYISNSAFEKAQLEFADTTLNFNKTMDTYNAMVITAPFDGEIGVIKPKVGDKIQVGDYLFSIVGQEVRAKSILVELPVVLYQKVDNHSEVIVTDNQENKIKGKIASISQYLSDNGTVLARITVDLTNNRSLSKLATTEEFLGEAKSSRAAYIDAAEERRRVSTTKLPVGVEFGKRSNILHGSYVNVDWLINKHKNLAIPSQAIQTNNQGDFIYKINNNIAEKLYVKLGVSLNNLTEIISNEITEGDLIVIEGLTKISDGSYVNLLPEKEETN